MVDISVGLGLVGLHLEVTRHMRGNHLHQVIQCRLVCLSFRLPRTGTVIIFTGRTDIIPVLGFQGRNKPQ